MIVSYTAGALDDLILVSHYVIVYQLRQHEVDVADDLKKDDVHKCGELSDVVHFELVIVVYHCALVLMLVKWSRLCF